MRPSRGYEACATVPRALTTAPVPTIWPASCEICSLEAFAALYEASGKAAASPLAIRGWADVRESSTLKWAPTASTARRSTTYPLNDHTEKRWRYAAGGSRDGTHSVVSAFKMPFRRPE